VPLDQSRKNHNPQTVCGLRSKGVFLPPGEARPVGGSPRFFGIASAARLAYVPQLLAPARC
jgi:hypothetical protein